MEFKELFWIAKQAAKDVYSDFHNIKTTEFNLKMITFNGQRVQVLSIAGSNEKLDWVLNFAIFSWKKFKIGSWFSARRIYKSKYYKRYRRSWLPLIITGHSKGAGTAVVFMKMYGDLKKDWCIAWNPCPTFRRYQNRELPRTFLFINKHDLVSYAGIVSFGHPDCVKYYNHEDLGGEADNHDIDQWDRIINLA